MTAKKTSKKTTVKKKPVKTIAATTESTRLTLGDLILGIPLPSARFVRNLLFFIGFTVAFSIGGCLESKYHFFENAPILRSSGSGLTQWSRNTVQVTIPVKYRTDFSTSLKEAISEALTMIDQGKFKDIPGENMATWKATDQARTEISLLFQAKLSETERNKNYSPADRKELAAAASVFLDKLGDRLSVYSNVDSLDTVKTVYGEISKGL